MTLHEPTLDLVDHRERTATVENPLQLGFGCVDQVLRLGFDDGRAREDVAVLALRSNTGAGSPGRVSRGRG